MNKLGKELLGNFNYRFRHNLRDGLSDHIHFRLGNQPREQITEQIWKHLQEQLWWQFTVPLVDSLSDLTGYRWIVPAAEHHGSRNPSDREQAPGRSARTIAR